MIFDDCCPCRGGGGGGGVKARPDCTWPHDRSNEQASKLSPNKRCAFAYVFATSSATMPAQQIILRRHTTAETVIHSSLVHGVIPINLQLADAKEMVEKSQALQAASGESVARLEDTQEAYKGSVVALQERLEASVNEINRGNAIIQKLQGQYRALRSKAKLKSEVIKQQVRSSSIDAALFVVAADCNVKKLSIYYTATAVFFPAFKSVPCYRAAALSFFLVLTK